MRTLHVLLMMMLVALLLCSSLAGADAVLLKQVPPTSWTRPYTPICVLYSALAGLGCSMQYDDLMVASGAAFRMSWMPGGWTISAGSVYQQDPISLGASAAGARADREQFQDVDAAFAAVKQSIDSGCPAIAWDEGHPGYQVICGYDAAARLVFRRTIATGEGAPEAKPAEVLKARSGAGAPYVLWLLTYDRTRAQPKLDWPMIITNALRLAQWRDDERLYGLLLCGDAAYYAFATELRQSKVPERFPNAGQYTYNMLRQIAQARSAAARTLQAHVGVHVAFLEAATMYESEAALLTQAVDAITGEPGMDYLKAMKVVDQNFQDLDTRMAVAALVEDALAKDRAARAGLTKALKDLAPDLAPAEQPAAGAGK